MKKCTLLVLLIFSIAAAAQNPTIHHISRPEKIWAITHPFVAKKAFHITQQVRLDVDSIKQTGSIGSDLNGGKLDAFKHAYWIASVSLKIGSTKALKLGKAHEKGNYLEYKKRRLEDAVLPDSVSSAMDLANNQAGINSFGNCRTSRSRRVLQQQILDALKKGKLFIIKKDEKGNYLACDGTTINLSDWKAKWSIPKCLVASDQP